MLSLSTLIVVSLLIHLAIAIPWAGPMPTQAGLVAMAGMSPRPTDAPGLEGIPQALRKRDVQYPPPDNWCGFIDGDYSGFGFPSHVVLCLIVVQTTLSLVGHNTPVAFQTRQLVAALMRPELAMLSTPHATTMAILVARLAYSTSQLENGMSNFAVDLLPKLNYAILFLFSN